MFTVEEKMICNRDRKPKGRSTLRPSLPVLCLSQKVGAQGGKCLRVSPAACALGWEGWRDRPPRGRTSPHWSRLPVGRAVTPPACLCRPLRQRAQTQVDLCPRQSLPLKPCVSLSVRKGKDKDVRSSLALPKTLSCFESTCFHSLVLSGLST